MSRWVSLARRPRLRQHDAFLTAKECRQLIRLVSGRMDGCALADGIDSFHERSSTGCWLPRCDAGSGEWRSFGASESDVHLIERIEKSLAAACGVPASHGEPSQILRYTAGQRYELHPDFFDPRDRAELANGGQRLFTCLVYLSSVPAVAGGATYFPDALLPGGKRGLRVHPEAGRAIVWQNAKLGGSVDTASIHAGERIARVRRRGSEMHRTAADGAAAHDNHDNGASNVHCHHVEKWVLSKWMREKPYRV